jgi:ribose/xylose/arabinose/galactoside ABC-type transport system permease subunit
MSTQTSATTPIEEAAVESMPPMLALRGAQFLRVREFGILIAAVALFTVLSLLKGDIFLSEYNLLNVARSISFMGIVAVGMTFLFIAGELDLSVGSMYGFLGIMMAYGIVNYDLNPFLAMPLTILLGVVLGFFSGWVTTFFKIPSFIVTLGMLSVLRGFALLRSGAWPIANLKFPTYRDITAGYAFNGRVPAQVFWFAGVVLIGAFVLAKTKFGYHVYATGDNARAAGHAGIPTSRIKIACFVITGALTGLVAALSVGWLKGANPLTGQSFELDVIAAVIIGGTNLFGGSGSILGTFLGAAIIGMMNNGLVLLGFNAYWIPVFQGGIIILAVLIDILIRRRQGL